MLIRANIGVSPIIAHTQRKKDSPHNIENVSEIYSHTRAMGRFLDLVSCNIKRTIQEGEGEREGGRANNICCPYSG